VNFWECFVPQLQSVNLIVIMYSDKHVLVIIYPFVFKLLTEKCDGRFSLGME
jgi:hypothetical protein